MCFAVCIFSSDVLIKIWLIFIPWDRLHATQHYEFGQNYFITCSNCSCSTQDQNK